MSTDLRRRQVVGRGLPLHGNDIDTDRVIPARFLKAVTFAGLGEHAFEDARKVDPEHPFNQKAYEGASVMVVGAEFRLRLLARARPAGPPRLGHPGPGGRVVRRDLLRQLHHQRHAMPAAPRPPTSTGSSARWAGARPSR